MALDSSISASANAFGTVSSRYASTCTRTQLTVASLAIILITSILLKFSIESAIPDGENSCGYNPGFVLQQEAVQITRTSLPMSDRMSTDTADFRLVRMMASAWSFTPVKERSAPSIDPARRMPVLFVHGHRGSYMQSQYVAAKLDEFAHQAAPDTQPSLDVWAIDFGNRAGGNPAFSASILVEQAWFINDALAYLQQLYGTNQRIQAFGLSFGGVALRLALTLDNHPTIPSNNQTGSFQSCLSVVYSLNSPHRAHPVFVESDMATLYHDLNHAYAEAYSDAAGFFSSRFQHTSFVSLSGGFRDRSVRSDLGSLEGIIPESHALHAYTSSIPDIDIEMDHDSIIWCRQMVVKLSAAMMEVAHIQRLTRAAASVQPSQMEFLQNHFQSNNPTKLLLTTVKRFRVSGVDESQFEPTLQLTDSQREELSSSSREALVLSHPSIHRNATSLHRDVRIQLTTPKTERCRPSKDVHTVHSYPVSNKGIYKLEIDSNLHSGASEQIMHSIRVPASAPFEFLTFISDIPAEYICMSLTASDSITDAAAAAERIDVSEWLVSLPENTADMTTMERLQNFEAEQHQRKANVHQWKKVYRAMTVLMLPHESMPITLRYLHIHFNLPQRAAGVPLYGLVQFTPPQHLTTKVESTWTGTHVSASHTSFIKLPPEFGVIPQSFKFVFQHFARAASTGPAAGGASTNETETNRADSKNNPWLFAPFFYTVAMPSGEASWGFRFQHKEGWLSTKTFHPHISTQPQTTHTIMFLDPTYDYRFIASHQNAHWYSFGLNFRVHHNYILLSFFAFLLIGLTLQIQTTFTAAAKLQQLVKEDKAMQQEQQVVEATNELQSPLYATLTSHIPSCIVISAFYCLMASNFYWLFQAQNVGYIPSMMLLFQYTMIGWSMLVVTHYILSKLHQLLVLMLRLCGCIRSHHQSHSQADDPIPTTTPQTTTSAWKKRVWSLCIFLAVSFYPYPTLAVYLFITTVRYVYLEAMQPSSGTPECMQFRSLVFFPVSHLIESVLFLLWIIVGTKSILIYQSCISSFPSLSLYSFFFQLHWLDACIVGLAVSFLRKMCWSSSSASMIATFAEFIPVNYAVKSYPHADQYAAILNRKAILRSCILAILAAYTSLYVYYYRMTYFTAIVLVGFLYEDMRQISTGVWGKLVDYNVGQGRHVSTTGSSLSHHHPQHREGEDDTPTLDMLGDLNSSHHHGRAAHWGSGIATDGAQEMQALLHSEEGSANNNQILRRSV